ncbi:hypothetical protein CBG46_09155 [Actinobacillus succinogenes]|uniref:Putative phage repressor n=1 Tax=Actinobacillus succinogenes (strain ATCC 55618 / DSM 22257 / CCUG 43843 / 130Z) TaxID=339671 RepID=A6VP57_ACTSZ|nr:helix-turn-helix transcriptional regulator [Actinobacillus succinogenes]ABR74754.1 putative phage repressor [Actinobacillus succinogenes 130Z]PHI40826.1 hypothetical protein CBG46_09155 [Actinobacillus succinogenes]
MANEDNFPERIELVINKLNGPSEFSRQTGVTLSTITRWRKGEADPSRTNLIKIAEAANVNLEWLATGKGSADNTATLDERTDGVGEITAYNSRSVARYEEFVNQFEFIPMHNDIVVSAGAGGYNEEEYDPNNVLAFRKDWLQSKGVKAKNCEVYFATGDSMYPTIQDKDLLLIDHSRNILQDGKVFVINNGGRLLVKRVQLQFGSVKLISDNASLYEPVIVPEAELDALIVLGEVMHIGHDLA